MSRFHLLLRFNLNKPILYQNVSVQKFRFSTDDSGEDKKAKPEMKPEETKVKDDKKPNVDALNKLNNLLIKMVQEDVVNTESQIKLSKPKNRRIPKDETSGEKPKKLDTLEEKTLTALQSVAKSMGGDVKQTESELLLKLLKPSAGKSDDGSGLNLNEIVKGMKIDREPKSVKPESRADQVREVLDGLGRGTPSRFPTEGRPRTRPERWTRPQRPRRDFVIEKIDLFGSEPLGIFTSSESDMSQRNEGPRNEVWDFLYEKELKLATTHPPENHFQQLILWTNQGKLWQFPIDNEQGLDAEKQVYFADHVFLDRFLDWCPPKGPIRHFMELVSIGLSKNPYLSVQAKKEHLDWFRDYFQDKKKLLQDVGALNLENVEEIASAPEPKKQLE